MSLEDLKKRLSDSKDTSWSHTGKSPLREQLSALAKGLEQLRDAMQAEQVKKLKVLEGLMRGQASSDPKYRVRKNVN